MFPICEHLIFFAFQLVKWKEYSLKAPCENIGKRILIKFIGTHAEYNNKIDANTI